MTRTLTTATEKDEERAPARMGDVVMAAVREHAGSPESPRTFGSKGSVYVRDTDMAPSYSGEVLMSAPGVYTSARVRCGGDPGAHALLHMLCMCEGPTGLLGTCPRAHLVLVSKLLTADLK